MKHYTTRLQRLVFFSAALFAMTLPIASAQTITPANLDDMQKAIATQSAVVVDIREPHEHARGVAKGALIIPMSQLGARLGELPKPDGTPLLVICNTQNRSAHIVNQLRAMGYANARYVNGGMSEWVSKGLPTVKP